MENCREGRLLSAIAWRQFDRSSVPLEGVLVRAGSFGVAFGGIFSGLYRLGSGIVSWRFGHERGLLWWQAESSGLLLVL